MRDQRARKCRTRVKDGDVFAVPIPSGGYVIGVVARVGDRNDMLAYFFEPRLQTLPSPDSMPRVSHAQAVASAYCSSLGISEFGWPLIGSTASDISWPVPVFSFYDPFTLRPCLVAPPNDPPFNQVDFLKVPCDPDDALRYSLSGLLNHGGVEDWLDIVIKQA